MNEKPVNVLLVEDSQTDAFLVQTMLERAEGVAFSLEAADRLSAGLARLSEGNIDVILLDLTLPDSMGLETLARVRARAQGVPIVVLTGLDDENLARAALVEGAADYLIKGEVNANWLARSLRYAIERKRVEKRPEALRDRPEVSAVKHLEIETIEEVAVGRFLEKKIVSPAAVEEIQDQLLRLIDRDGCKKLLLSFANVKYFSNAAMGMLLVVENRLRDVKGKLRLCCISPEVHEHFVTRRLHDMFVIFETEQTALKSL